MGKKRKQIHLLMTGLALLFFWAGLRSPATAWGDQTYAYPIHPSSLNRDIYNTAMGPDARHYQEKLLRIESQVYGLDLRPNQDAIYLSEHCFLLENKILRLHLDIANSPLEAMTDFERESLLYGTIRIYSSIRNHSERLYEQMLRFIDKQIPGPNGKQLRSDSKYGSLYEPNYRTEKALSPAERDGKYRQLKETFLTKGGSMKEIRTLTQDLFRSFGAYTWLEYAWLPDNSIRVTPGKAGHVLLARGGAVKSAGQIVILKNAEGKASMLIVSNASGNYKPDLLSARNVSERIQKIIGVNAHNMVLTKAEPVSTQTLKIFLKGRKMDARESQKRTSTAEKSGHALLYPTGFLSFGCGNVFSLR